MTTNENLQIVPNIISGELLRKDILKSRLAKMKISFDPEIEVKKYFVDLYNKHVQVDSSRAKISDDLLNDEMEMKQQMDNKKTRFRNNETASVDKSLSGNENSINSKKMIKIEENKITSNKFIEKTLTGSIRNGSSSSLNDNTGTGISNKVSLFIV